MVIPALRSLGAGQFLPADPLRAYSDNVVIASTTNISAPAVEYIAHIHGRVPVILEEDDYDEWLSFKAHC